MRVFMENRQATMYVYGTIGSSWWDEDSVTAADMARALKDVEGADNILVRVNSDGGEIFEAIAMRSLLNDNPAEINFQIDGVAASAAGYLTTVGDYVTMAQNSMFMLHKPWGVAIGPDDAMIHMAGVLDKITGEMTTTYATKTGQTREDIGDMLAAETWLTATEAVDQGFANEVLADRSASPQVSARWEYKHAPAAIVVPDRDDISPINKALLYLRQVELTRQRLAG